MQWVMLKGMILKPNVVLSGLTCAGQATAFELHFNTVSRKSKTFWDLKTQQLFEE